MHVQSFQGCTALTYACIRGGEERAKLLLSNASVSETDMEDKSDQTTKVCTARHGCSTLVKPVTNVGTGREATHRRCR